MSGFQGNETVRVDFPDGEWVDVKEELSQADQDFITNSMISVTTEGKSANVSTNLGKLALLERAVVKWSFPDMLNRENLSILKRKYRVPLLQKIDELNSDEFIKNSPKAST
jgi:hypothetical protein